MNRLSEDHFFQSHHIHGFNYPMFYDDENRLKTLLDWYDFMRNGNYLLENKTILNKVQSIDFIHFHDLNYFNEILKDIHRIYSKSFPFSEIEDFFDYTLSVTYYEIKELLNNEKRIVWDNCINNYNFYYFVNQTSEREYFCLGDKIHIDNLFHYYRKVIKIIDDFIQSNSVKIESISQTLIINKAYTSIFKSEKSNQIFDFIIENWNYIPDIKYSYLYNYFETEHLEYLYKNEYERFIRTQFNFTGKFQYDKAISEKVIKQLKDLEKKLDLN